MSDTKKADKRGWRRVRGKPRSPGQAETVRSRHTFGRTEKILRRNRKTWTRLHSKIGRQLDKQEVQEQTP
jgi:hypothetical protein